LRRIEGQGCADFLVDQLLELTEQQQKEALEYGFWAGFKAMRSKQLPDALRRIASSAADPKLQELARQRASEVGG
jgi:hypothetical protein